MIDLLSGCVIVLEFRNLLKYVKLKGNEMKLPKTPQEHQRKAWFARILAFLYRLL